MDEDLAQVGSGLSTYYASLAGQRVRLHAGDLHRPAITSEALKTISGITVLQHEVQDVRLELFTELGEDDVLFIDASHNVRLDGDVPFLFLEV